MDAAAAERIAQELDEAYLIAHDNEDEPPSVWEPMFQQARLAAALRIMVDGITPENIGGFVYECAYSQPDPAGFVKQMAFAR